MYEPIRTKSVHTMADSAVHEVPQRSREEELDIRLAGHLTALLTVTDELRVLLPDASFHEAAYRLAAQVARLRGREPLRAAPSARDTGAAHLAALHQRAHTLAGNALVIATSREDEAAMELAAARMESHAAALGVSTTA
ncbi:SCO4983 family protein [Streptomyces sp. NPDC054796]